MKILWGDCRKILSTIKPESVQMVFTDPPFGISKGRGHRTPNKYSSYQPNKGPWDEVVTAQEWVPLVVNCLAPGGIFMVFGVFGSLIPIFKACFRSGLRFQTHISWHKTNPAPCVHRRGLTMANEFILVFSKGPKWYFDYPESKRQNKGKQQHNHIDCPAVKRISGRTRKPQTLVARYIKLYCPRNGLVLDPFAGTGSILEAAESVGRKALGIEIDKQLRRKP
jgi:site-specific DNA-methyltransferase (adenine-specific)